MTMEDRLKLKVFLTNWINILEKNRQYKMEKYLAIEI